MLNIFLDFVIIFLLLYSLISISSKIMFLLTRKSKNEELFALLAPDNSDCLEMTVRCAAKKCLRCGLVLVIISDNLTESSLYIISKLKKEFSNLICLSAKDLEQKNIL